MIYAYPWTSLLCEVYASHVVLVFLYVCLLWCFVPKPICTVSTRVPVFKSADVVSVNNSIATGSHHAHTSCSTWASYIRILFHRSLKFTKHTE